MPANKIAGFGCSLKSAQNAFFLALARFGGTGVNYIPAPFFVALKQKNARAITAQVVR